MWLAVSFGTDGYTEDCMALEVLTKAVPPELMGTITNKASAKAAWDALYLHNVGTKRVCKARVSTLRQEFNSLKFEAGETIDDFGACTNRLTTQLAVLRSSYIEEEIIRCFLQALLPRFDQRAASIETVLDLVDVSLDELIGWLKWVEEKMNHDNRESMAKLDLMEDELATCFSSLLKTTGFGNPGLSKEGSSGGKRGHGCGHSKNRGSHGGADGGGRIGGNGGHGNGSGDGAGDECHYCGKKGHWARESKKNKQDE
jgi:hypothetical protein